jgi:hypothetical protein
MKLYDVPKNTKIRVGDVPLMFHHIDGMYSLCTDEHGHPVHLAAWTDVECVSEADTDQSQSSETRLDM